VRADLQRSGLFRASDAPEPLDERSTINAADWRARGADAVVGGSVTRLADGRLDVRYKLWDAVKGEQLLGQSKLVLPADLRLAAHRVADEIYQASPASAACSPPASPTWCAAAAATRCT
jgi:TolB protein